MPGFIQVVLSAAGDDLAAVVNEDLQGTLEGQQAGFAVDQRQQVDAKGGLQGGEFINAVENPLGLGAAL